MPLTRRFNQADANTALLQVGKAAIDLESSVFEANLETPPATDDEKEDSSNPIFNSFLTDQSDRADCLKMLTNFGEKKFKVLPDLFSETMQHSIYSGRGQKSSDSPQDLLFMLQY